MKRIITLAVIVLLLASMAAPAHASHENASSNQNTYITLAIGSPIMTVNGVRQLIDSEGGAPLIYRGRTMVPLRPIFEALSLQIGWEREGVITGSRGNDTIRLMIGSRAALINNSYFHLDVPPIVINGNTMVPLRFIAESVGAHVMWCPATQTIEISENGTFVELQGIRLAIGDPQERVVRLLGLPDRVDPSLHCFQWHVYNSNYSRFIMVGIKNGFVEALYTNSRGFVTNIARYGDPRSSVGADSNVQLYFDKNDGDRVHAVLMLSSNVQRAASMENRRHPELEMQNFDVTNAFRANHGLPPVLWDDTAAMAARAHSQDMANNDYFSHTSRDGRSPWSRFEQAGGIARRVAENLTMGYLFGFDAFDGLVNSNAHRENMLDPAHQYLGVGFAFNASRAFAYYYGQLFFT